MKTWIEHGGWSNLVGPYRIIGLLGRAGRILIEGLQSLCYAVQIHTLVERNCHQG